MMRGYEVNVGYLKDITEEFIEIESRDSKYYETPACYSVEQSAGIRWIDTDTIIKIGCGHWISPPRVGLTLKKRFQSWFDEYILSDFFANRDEDMGDL